MYGTLSKSRPLVAAVRLVPCVVERVESCVVYVSSAFATPEFLAQAQIQDAVGYLRVGKDLEWTLVISSEAPQQWNLFCYSAGSFAALFL